MRAAISIRRIQGLIALVLIVAAGAALPTARARASETRPGGAAVPGAVVRGAALAGTGVLNDVVATSASNAWAVGHSGSIRAAATNSLIEHWNGKAWRRVAVKPAHAWLNGLAATSADDVWAVGFGFSGSSANTAVILHFNGTTWQRYSPPGAVLAAVTAISPTNAWAVGGTSSGSLILHWNGKTWRRVPSPSPGGLNAFLNDVSAVSAKNIWAVGGFNNTVTLHWNGSVWRRVASPNPPGSALNGVAAIAAHNVWAVGETVHGNLTLHWNGTHWRKVASPVVANGAGLNSVSAISANNVWAAGTSGGLIQAASAAGVAMRGDLGPIRAVAATTTPEPIIEHWNGTAWRRVSAPRPDHGGQLIGTFASSAARTSWAVGCTRNFAAVKARPLAVRLTAP